MAAAPLAAQTRSNGPWWDPGRTQTTTRNGGTVYGGRNGSVYGRNGSVQADGVWRADSRDRNGNTIYVRTRYDSNGNLIREYATRNIIGRYSVIDRQVLSNGNSRGTYGNRGSYGTYGNQSGRRGDDQDEDDGYGRRGDENSNDRWGQNNGHDNGRHNGWYKNGKNGKHHD
jgi:hypothetical protein